MSARRNRRWHEWRDSSRIRPLWHELDLDGNAAVAERGNAHVETITDL